jgi:hypothetical protein
MKSLLGLTRPVGLAILATRLRREVCLRACRAKLAARLPREVGCAPAALRDVAQGARLGVVGPSVRDASPNA